MCHNQGMTSHERLILEPHEGHEACKKQHAQGVSNQGMHVMQWRSRGGHVCIVREQGQEGAHRAAAHDARQQP